MFKVVISLLIASLAATNAHAEIRTILRYNALSVPYPGTAGINKVIDLKADEVATLVGVSYGANLVLRFIDRKLPPHSIGAVQAPCGFQIRGPVEISLPPTPEGSIMVATLRIEKDSPPTPPDRTVAIPAGQGAAITLQCSSNLVDWVTANNGIYTNVPIMKFFRIYSEKLP